MDVAELSRHFDQHSDAVQAALARAAEKTKEQTEKLAALEVGLAGVTNDVHSLHQKGVRIGSGGSYAAPKSWGAEVAASEALKNFAQITERPARTRIELSTKTITTLPDSAGALVEPSRQALVPLPQQRLLVRDLVRVVGVSSGQIEFPRMLAPRALNPGWVAEGAAKPESDIKFELVTAPVRTLAHWVVCSRQIISDAPMMQSVLEGELVWGLRKVEELALLYGDGLGQSLLGMIVQAQAFASPIVLPTPVTAIDTIAAALTQVAMNDYAPDGIILNPADWLAMRVLKSSTGEFLLGPPNVDVRPQLFGYPVAITESISKGTFLVGAFKSAAVIWDRLAPVTLISSEHSDLFIKNCVLVLVEERVGFSVTAPLGLVTGTLPAPT